MAGRPPWVAIAFALNLAEVLTRSRSSVSAGTAPARGRGRFLVVARLRVDRLVVTMRPLYGAASNGSRALLAGAGSKGEGGRRQATACRSPPRSGRSGVAGDCGRLAAVARRGELWVGGVERGVSTAMSAKATLDRRRGGMVQRDLGDKLGDVWHAPRVGKSRESGSHSRLPKKSVATSRTHRNCALPEAGRRPVSSRSPRAPLSRDGVAV